MSFKYSFKYFSLAILLHFTIIFLLLNNSFSSAKYDIQSFNFSIKYISQNHKHNNALDNSSPTVNNKNGYAEIDSHKAFKENSDYEEAIYDSSILKNNPPKYPAIARRNREEGLVLVEVLIDEDGQLKDLKIIKSSESEILDRAAVGAISEWSFIPAKKAGVAIISKIVIPINFKLNDVS